MRIGMRKFSQTIFKNKSGSDVAQTPATATIDVYKRGATVNGTVTVGTGAAGTAVTVFNIGRIVNGDTLQADTDATKTFSVVTTAGYPTSTVLYIKSTTGSNIALSTGQRLVVTNNRPVVYSDDQGVASLGSTVQTSSATGAVSFYIPDTFFDYIVSGSGLTTSLVTDGQGGWLYGSQPVINAKDYPTIQAAVDSAPKDSSDGGIPIVYIPGGAYSGSTVPSYTAPLLFPNDRALRVIGAGKKSTRLSTTSASVNMVEMRHDWQHLEGMSLAAPQSTGNGRVIQVGRVASENPDGLVTRFCVIKNIEIQSSASYALGFYGVNPAFETGPKTNVDGNSLCVAIIIEDVQQASNFQDGAVWAGPGTTTLYFSECAFNSNSGPGVTFKQAYGCQMHNCIIEPCPKDQPYLLLDQSNNFLGNNMWFEDTPAGGNPTEYFVVVKGECDGIVFNSPRFVRVTNTSDVCKFMHFDSKVSGATVIGAAGFLNHVFGTDVDNIQVDDPTFPNFSSSVTLLGNNSVADTATGHIPMAVTWGGTVPKGSMFGAKIRWPAYTSVQRDLGNLGPLRNKAKYDTIVNATIGVAQVYDGAKWRNFPPPILTSTQRDVATETAQWQDGESIYVSDVPAWFDRSNGAWRIRTGSSLTTTQRDAATWTPVNGDIIYNSTTAAYNIRLGGAWKVSSWT